MQKLTNDVLLLVVAGTGSIFLLVVSFILINSRSQNKMLLQRQQLQKAEIAHQKELLNAVIESQEAERKRVGRDLHDDVGTALSSLRLIIEMSKPTENERGHKAFITSTKNIIDKVIKDVRGISHNLSPTTLSYYGLVAAIEEHCNIINQSGKMEVKLENNAEITITSLNLSAATALYRVLEELLNNTIKHAGATTTMIGFDEQNELLLINYNDNGKGMVLNAADNKGMGMQNIESRLNNIGANYKINSGIGQGFNIEIQYKVKQMVD
jgi:signal transduction histidine kinase